MVEEKIDYDKLEWLESDESEVEKKKTQNRIDNDLLKEGVYKYKRKNKTNQQVLNKYFEFIKDKKWADASEVLVEWYLSDKKVYTTKNDIKSEIWIYQDGIYIPQGRSDIKEQLRILLGKWYSMFVVNQVIAKIEADTLIDADKFFGVNYKNELPIQNGILNVETLELIPYTPDKIFFSKMPVKFNPDAECPMIDKFLSEVLPNEEDKNLIYELAGFCLLKEYRYEKAFMFLGYGRNGKGKTLELFKRTYGVSNCCSIPLPLLTSDSFSISELFGKLINLAGDINNKDLKDTGMFKSATGRDLIAGKRKFLPDLFFENYAKFIFACNELPTVYDMSKGFWDRWELLEFPYTFVTQDEYNKAENKTNLKIRDEDIINKITTEQELSGFLNQALLGLQRLRINKHFSNTKGSEAVKTTWIRNSNSCMAFCLDNVEDSYDGSITKREFRKRYAQYCKQHRLKNKSDVVVKNVLQEMFGVSEGRKYEGFEQEYFWIGVKWKQIS